MEIEKTHRPRLTTQEYNILKEWRKNKNVLVIGDLHAPFIKPGYLEFCKHIYDKHNCQEVVFIGDIIDNHYASYHETDPDGFGGAEELRIAQEQISQFYKTFPKAKVCIGNHDRLPNRKAFTAGVSSKWVKSISEVLETPNWEFSEKFIIDNVLYCHGEGMAIKRRSSEEGISVVSGHHHSKSFYETFTGENGVRFVLQIGCGVDAESYAMAYAKWHARQQINVGVVFDFGKQALIETMFN